MYQQEGQPQVPTYQGPGYPTAPPMPIYQQQMPPQYYYPPQPSQVIVLASAPQRASMENNTVVNVNQKTNHCFYCVLTVCTGGLTLPCWIGACCGCCPSCN